MPLSPTAWGVTAVRVNGATDGAVKLSPPKLKTATNAKPESAIFATALDRAMMLGEDVEQCG
jgi:hypothetical protein